MEHLEPRQAYEFLQRRPDALLIDCRSELEAAFVGYPLGSVNVPWNDGPEMARNAQFAAQLRQLAGDAHRPVVLICRSGNRSVEAGSELERSGFTQVYNVLHGFEGDLDDRRRRNTRAGWRFEGLPWEQT
ncbi:MAG: rhodanese-like domain-containing protein [Burkholderiales bacterium]